MGSISLREGLKIHGPMGESDVKTLGLKIANCLQEVHREGKVLGTVSPDIVFITDDGRVKIGNTAQELRGPTLREYVSPEVLVGKRAQAQSDIYQLGLLLMEASLGVPPFGWLEESLRAAAITSESPYKQKCSLSRDFARLLDACVARNQEERPQTAGEFTEQLLAISEERDFASTFASWLAQFPDTSEEAISAVVVDTATPVAITRKQEGAQSYGWFLGILLITVALMAGAYFLLNQEEGDLISGLSIKVKNTAVTVKWTSPETLSRIEWKLSVKGKVIKTGTSLASSFSTHSLFFSNLQSGQVHVVVLSHRGDELGKLAFTPGIEVQ